ncbi:MAG: hypothetical protein JNG89_02860 [Planctomycetaceae bacterium]|nr:hypothetical protein [Planctomycetaceae bacterium]
MTRRLPPPGAVFRWSCLPQPERLLELAESAASSPANAAELCDEFSAIITSIWINDVNKRTARGRLPLTLSAIVDALPRGIEKVRCLDLGASDGVSTHDLVCLLREQLRVPVSACAVDLHTRLIRHDGRWLREYRTSDGSPVLLRVGPIGLRLGRTLSFPPAELCRTLYLQWRRLRAGLRPAQVIPLIHPLAAGDPDITVREADALQHCPRFAGAFEVVRISNLLNLSYFSRSEIEQIVGHAVTYLAESGLLVLSKNQPNGGATAERGSVWRRTGAGLRRVCDFNGGFELRDWLRQFEAGETAARAAA